MKRTVLVFLSALGFTCLPHTAWGGTLAEASALYFDHHPQKALQEFIEISKQTRAREAFLNAVFIALEQNNIHQAIDTALAAYKLYPQDEEVADFLAQALLADGQYAAAERVLLAIKNPSAILHEWLLARAQLKLGDFQTARRTLEQSLQKPLFRPLVLYELGLLTEQEKNLDKAAEYFNQAITEDHQFFEARRALARVLEENGQPEEALRQYNMLRAATKNDTQTNEALARLRPLVQTATDNQAVSKESRAHTFVVPLPRSDDTTVRIGLGVQANGKPAAMKTITFSPSHAFSVVNEKNIKIAQGKGKEIWKVILTKHQPALVSPDGKKYPFKRKIKIIPFSNEAEKEPTFILKNIVSGAGMTWMRVEDKEYRGQLEVLHHAALNTLIPVNVVPMENYLQGVISAEMPIGFPAEALKAQTVLARTYAHKHLGKHKAYGYDLCDSQNCQVYSGVQAETEDADAAVIATAGNVLLYDEKPIEAVFSANTGGMTQRAEEAGWKDSPYLEMSSDYKEPLEEPLQPYQLQTLLQNPPPAYDYYNKNVSLAAFRWARVMPAEDVAHIITRVHKDIGPITALRVAERTPSGYVKKVFVQGEKGQVTLSKENVIRGQLGLGMLRSSFFMVVPHYQDKKLTHFVFYGGGWGHGVGFDQTGAAGRADDGQTYEEILKHYFPQAKMTENKIIANPQ